MAIAIILSIGRTWKTKAAALGHFKAMLARYADGNVVEDRNNHDWNLTARGNLAFIANQMGHSDYSMLVKVYGRWIDSGSPMELGRIWKGMKILVQTVPNLPR